MTAAESVLAFAGEKAGKATAVYLIDEHLSREDAAKIKEALGLSTPDMRPMLEQISGKIDKLATISRNIEDIVTNLKLDSVIIDLRANLDGFIDAYDRFGKFATKHMGAYIAHTVPEDVAREGNRLDEQLQAACRTVFASKGATYQAKQLIAAATTTTTGKGSNLFKTLDAIYRREALDVFRYSKQMNRIYGEILKYVLLTVAVTAEAYAVYNRHGGKPRDVFEPDYDGLRVLQETYKEITGPCHHQAHRLRELAKNKANVLIRRAADNLADSLFLMGYGPGGHDSTEQSVGTGDNHGQLRTAYDIRFYQSSKSHQPPQVLTPNIALGTTHKIEIKDKKAWSTIVGGAASRLFPATFGGAAILEAIADKSTVDKFVHNTASQLWTLDIATHGEDEFLILTNVQAEKRLAVNTETNRAALSGGGQWTLWRPILSARAGKFPCRDPLDQAAFRLSSAIHGERILHSAVDLSVRCESDKTSDGETDRWQIITETTLPPDHFMVPGCFMTSTNQEYALSYMQNAAKVFLLNKKGEHLREVTKAVDNDSAGRLVMQKDGNLVLNNDARPSMTIWETKTQSAENANSGLVVTNDGKVLVVNLKGKVVMEL